ncbi:IS3 family transposase [Enterococcus faecalis]|uniref:IS3 family transposase n=1 Tax=Enterococcus faecalis TaxID=1351 RepID=UPI003D6AE657
MDIAKLPKSSYYEWKIKLEQPIDKDKQIKEEIKTIVEASKGRYGYRRVTLVLKIKDLKLTIKEF